MKTVVEKAKLVEIITKNRQEHQTIYEEAVLGYREAVVNALSEVNEKWRTDLKLDATPINKLVEPQNYIKEYDEALGMLDLTSQDEIELEQDEYRQYVLDKWHFARQFFGANSRYVNDAHVTAMSSKM